MYQFSLSRIKCHICSRQPRRALNEWVDGILRGLGRRECGLIPDPFNPIRSVGARPGVLILSINNRAGRVDTSNPRNPAQRAQKPTNLGLHNNGGRKIFPWAAQISWCSEFIKGAHHTSLDGNPSVLIRVLLPLCSYGHKLVGHGLSRHDVAVLEDDGRVPEDEVDCARDVAVAVELTVRVGVESVLERIEGASVEDRLVGPRSEGHGLVLCCTGRVLEPYVPSYESFTGNTCYIKNLICLNYNYIIWRASQLF